MSQGPSLFDIMMAITNSLGGGLLSMAALMDIRGELCISVVRLIIGPILCLVCS